MPRAGINALSYEMRDVLIEHIDGSAAIDVRDLPRDHTDFNSRRQRHRTVVALIGRRLLRFDALITPKETLITEAGRAMLAAILADHAEALVRAGFWISEGIEQMSEADIIRLQAAE